MLGWIKSKVQRFVSRPGASVDPGGHQRLAGNALLAEGDVRGAEKCYRVAVSTDSLNPLAHINLAFVLIQQERSDEALAELNLALNLDANSADCHYLLGGLLEGRFDFANAALHYSRAFELKPDFELACRDTCRALFQLGRVAEAGKLIAAGLTLNPNFADFHFYQGNLYLAENLLDSALVSYRSAINLGADYPALHGFVGGILLQKNEIHTALTHLQRAVQLDPGNTEAHHDLGVVFHRLGLIEQAIQQQRIAVAQDPDLLQAHSCLLFALSFVVGGKPHEYLAAAQHYGERARRAVGSTFPSHPFRNLQPGQPFCIGWVSGDLRAHAVALFLEGVIECLVDEPLELIAFSNNPYDDEVTERLRARFSQWYDIASLSDLQAAMLIQNCQVDVLVDLSGHTAHNRLPVFAYRPARVQVSWLGYFASTGLAEMDYLLADRLSVPEERQSYFTERIWYLPQTRLCMKSVYAAEDYPVGRLPATVVGHVTFGCFQAIAKISNEVLRAWGKVIAGVPGSRLRMQIRHLEQAGVREDLLQRLSQAGIAPNRVSLHSGTQTAAYLNAHNEVDLILDTFPYPGGTTTSEALWMGVPTVTLQGDSLLARQGASMLHNAGLPDWIATDEPDYVRRAINFASNLQALGHLRAQLRQQVLASPLFDTKRFAADLLAALRGMHRDRCSE